MITKLVKIAAVTVMSTAFVSTPVLAENLEHTRQLLSTKSCPGCDLAQAGLVFAQLAGANLSGANLVRANLSQADLTGADLRNANLVGASFAGASLMGANLQGANLQGADLRGAYLTDANLEDADLTNANLKGALGIPSYAVTATDLVAWGNDEAQLGNFSQAVAYYDEALLLDPNFADAYLVRAAARNRMSDKSGAIADAKQASDLYFVEGDQEGYNSATLFVAAIEAELEAARKGPRGPSFLNTLGNIGVMLLQFGLF
jgi:uncharacterized protein YjbI with pentapeptide repeats